MFGLVARTTSCTPFRSTRPISSSMRRWSGSTPSRGESAPPSTWYSPRNSLVLSTEMRSTGCSTTQIIVWSRRASRQIAQTSSSVRLPHSLQKRTRAFTSSIAVASARASSFGRCKRWNARRCAVRVPTPGRRDSCATRFSTAGLSIVLLCREPSDCQDTCRRRSPRSGRAAMTSSSSGRGIARQRTSVSARTLAVRSMPSSSERSPKTSPGPSSRVPSGAWTTARPSSSTKKPEPGSPRWISGCPATTLNSRLQEASTSSCSSSRSEKTSSARRRSRNLLTEPGQAEAAESAAGEAAELRLLQASRRPDRLVDRGQHHFGEHFGIARIDRLRVDLDLLDVARAVRRHGHHSAAGARLDRCVLQLVLRFLHLLLHLAELLHQLVHVHAHSSVLPFARVQRFLDQLENLLFSGRLLVFCFVGRARLTLSKCKPEATAGHLVQRV